MWTNFVDKLLNDINTRQSHVALFINPRILELPFPITRFDDPFFPYSKALIQATRDIVCAYVFDLASYLALGAAGAVALERSIRYAGQETLTILHGPFTGAGYSPMADATGFGIDALTVNGDTWLRTYLDNLPHAAFAIKQGKVENEQTPEVGGLFWQDAHCITFRDTIENIHTLRLTDDTILYAGKLDDYAEKVREGIQSLR